MNLKRIDIISLLDLRFDGVKSLSQFSAGSQSRMVDRLNESFDWLFYGEQLRDFELYDISSTVPDAAGAILRIHRRLNIGTHIVWRSYDASHDPHELKASAWDRTNDDSSPVKRWFENLRTDRYYPFVAIRADADDVDAFATQNAEEIGRLLTGNLEGERPSDLCRYVEDDLSRRRYEKLLLLWTDALALYSRTEPEEQYERCMFRAVQVYENCILARVSLLALSERMDRFQRHLFFVTPWAWFRSRELLATFSSVEEVFVMYPLVQSVEADRLIATAHVRFGLDKVLAGTKAKQAELREQMEWAKAQTLGLIAVGVYVLDKIVGWDNVRHWLARLL